MILRSGGMALYLPFFVLLQRSALFAKWVNRGEGRTAWLTVVASVGASFLEWVFAGLTFWFIAGELLGSTPFLTVFSIYVVAAIAGILSMAPGGIGAFDLIALLGLTQLGIKSDHAMAVLVIYRLFYYIIPWLIGLVLAALEFGLPGTKGAERSGDRVDAPPDGLAENMGLARSIYLPQRSGGYGHSASWSWPVACFCCCPQLRLSCSTG
ncbi:flippase-like domain-containing protein [Paenibacillus rhizoplanae]